MSLNKIRTMQAQFQEWYSRQVLLGVGDPDPAAGTLNAAYFDTSTVPATAWVKQQSGWKKASHGATEKRVPESDSQTQVYAARISGKEPTKVTLPIRAEDILSSLKRSEG